MSGEPTPVRPPLPATLSWYRDAANWVVGLSTAALAAGFAYRDEIQAAAAASRLAFVAAAVLFLAALLAGVQFYFWITTYANQRERRDGLQAQAAAGGDIASALADAEARMARAQRWFGYHYSLLLWAFHLGVLGYAAVTVTLFVRGKPAARSWELVTVPCCQNMRCRLPQPHVLRIERTTGQTWVLTADSLQSGEWRQIPEGADTGPAR